MANQSKSKKSKGGARPGAGRKPGSLNKANSALRDEVAATGITPLAYMLNVLRDETATEERRMWAAQNAAPYSHAKLSAIHATQDDDKADIRSWMVAATGDEDE